MNNIRIGFVGVGNMGQCAHLANYTDLPGCEVVALAEVRPQLGERVAERYGVPRVYPDHQAMLAREELDGIVASQPFRRHGALLPELFAADLPVLSEKPLAQSIAAGERILSALRDSAARHALGYHKRSDLATVHARKIIDEWKESGKMGALKYIRIVMPPGDWLAAGWTHRLTSEEPLPKLSTDPPPADMDEESFKRYNAFVNYYIHQVNLLRHLLGEDYAVDYAEPSGVLLVARSANGVTATIEMAPYRTTVEWHEEALVAFERGFVRLELPAPMVVNRPGRVTILRDPGEGAPAETITPHLPWVHAMRQQAAYFVDFIKGKETPLCGPEEALKDLVIAKDYIERQVHSEAVTAGH